MIMGRLSNKLWDLVGQCLDLDRIVGDREGALLKDLVLIIGDTLVILRDKVIV